MCDYQNLIPFARRISRNEIYVAYNLRWVTEGIFEATCDPVESCIVGDVSAAILWFKPRLAEFAGVHSKKLTPLWVYCLPKWLYLSI